ncbi:MULTISPECIES: LLM class flavin-dependent oxidoreductase [unclassified Brevibacterium]|uniref:LLM class flavin-dependent oxidoreductase n=1 Tax=unclassified Brevibacterium TaxID=2614124 RepID=UPI0010F5B8B9|nr:MULTISPECIES: LLM class flavin-dependent oxidoreductase [unclassified Brevibacterium]MCM1013749.1 LLM class flavin-dependent oxidoreductase [Brevibacterium sp. XM4083]
MTENSATESPATESSATENPAITDAGPTLGFFTRLLEDAPADQRYRFALEQIEQAERFGFGTAWVAQHHFSAAEGGLPSPLVFLSHAAARTDRIRLGTAIITLPMENAVRVAEDAAVVDVLAGGRLEIGLGSGGNPRSFPAFGTTFDDRREVFAGNLAALRTLLAGDALETGHLLYPGPDHVGSAGGSSESAGRSALDGSPTRRRLSDRLWQATFSAGGAGAAGAAGDGLMLSRTQPRPGDNLGASLDEIQLPVIDTYLEALPAGVAPRILASRTAVVADAEDLPRLRELTEPALRAEADRLVGYDTSGLTLDELLTATDTYLGTPEQVIERLAADRVLGRVSDVSFQVHSVPATNAHTLRSIELLATEVAPALGLRVDGADPAESAGVAQAVGIAESAGVAP